MPEYLRHPHAYPDIWRIDMIEWEMDGDVELLAAALCGDGRYADVVRRRALLVLLSVLDDRPLGVGPPPTPKGGEREKLSCRLARGLGEMTTYASLRPLERLYETGDSEVRRSVMLSLSQLCFKRSFQLVRKGLRDDTKTVREAALWALGSLHFPHAVDPLIRIFREHADQATKEAVLESLGKVGDLGAGEFLLEVLRHEPAPFSDFAQSQLMKCKSPEILPLLRKSYEMESGHTRAMLEVILRAHH
jgi:hypothetical protein